MTGTDQNAIRIADHPRAMRQIELARGWGGIGCFLFVGLVSLQSSVPPLDAGVAGWGLSLMVWRHLALAEAAAARDSAEARRAALIEQIETRAAALGAGGPEPGGAGVPPMPGPAAAAPLSTDRAATARAPEEAIAR